MIKILAIVPFFFILETCNIQEGHVPGPENADFEDFRKIAVLDHFDALDLANMRDKDTTYVLNFWATSCPPCIKEMPYFEKLNETYATEKLRVLLISVDMKRHLESRVLPFLTKHNIRSEVILLGDQNYSKWTGEIDPAWYGALPATLVFRGTERHFSFGAFDSYDDLTTVVLPLLRPS